MRPAGLLVESATCTACALRARYMHTPAEGADSTIAQPQAKLLDGHAISKLAGRPLDEASTGAAASYSEEMAGGKALQADEEAAFMAASMMAKEQEKKEL